MATRSIPDDPIRIGIAGLGYIGSYVGSQFHRHPGAAVVAVCDLEADRRSTVGERFSVPPARRFESYATMLERASLDAVLVGTPHTLHYEQVSLALDHGLDVYCDKPLTTTLEHARELASRATAGEETLMVGYQRHLQTAFRRARERFRSPSNAEDVDDVHEIEGTAREPKWLTASITQDWIDDSMDSWRLDPALSGGGFLYDTGSHVLDAVLWTTGLTPDSVRASMDFHDEAERIDRRAHLDVRFRNGATGSFAFNGAVAPTREHVHIWDGSGAIYLEGKEWRSRRVFEIDEESTEHHPYIDPRRERSRADAFVEAVHEGTEPPATARDALAVTALTEAAYESARRGERVSVAL